MTRRSKRELERALADLDDADRGDPAAGGFAVSTTWGEEEPDPNADFAIQYQIVMSRDRAERDGREILGPADAPGDTVRVTPRDRP